MTPEQTSHKIIVLLALVAITACVLQALGVRFVGAM